MVRITTCLAATIKSFCPYALWENWSRMGSLTDSRTHATFAWLMSLSGHEHNYDDVRCEGFFGQTRRERRAYPSGVCEERATKSGRKRTAARRVAPNLACGCVARRSQIHFGICYLLAPCHMPNSAQRTSS